MYLHPRRRPLCPFPAKRMCSSQSTVSTASAAITLITTRKWAVLARLSGKVGVKNTGRLTVITASAREGEETLWFTWYNMPFLRNTLRPGGLYIFRGLVVEKKGRKTMEHPEIFSREQYEERLHVLYPIYSLTKGLTNKFMAKTMRQILEEREMTQEYLPEDFTVGQMRAEYKKQAVLNDVILPKVKEEEDVYTVVLESPEKEVYAVVELRK